MRAGRQYGITIVKFLVTIALVWGVFTVWRAPPAELTKLFNQKVTAGEYFNGVLNGIERAREVNTRTPLPQRCDAFTTRRAEENEVKTCLYQPSASRTFYILTVTSEVGDVFRYSGRGSR